MYPIPKPLADVLALLAYEELPRGEDDNFRCWCSADLAVRLFVYDRTERPCYVSWIDETDQAWHFWADCAYVLEWLTTRREYERAMRARVA